jgi:hypothetical protein
MNLTGFSPWGSRQGLKPSENALLAARLKPCPDSKRPTSEFGSTTMQDEEDEENKSGERVRTARHKEVTEDIETLTHAYSSVIQSVID